MKNARLLTVLGLFLAGIASAAHADDGYVSVTSSNGKTHLTATWSVGKNPAAGHENSWVSIEATDSANSLVVSAYDAVRDKQFDCFLWEYNSHYIKVRRTLQLFAEGARLEMTSNSNAECTLTRVVVDPRF